MFEVYNMATEEPYSFLFFNVLKADLNEMFMKDLTLNKFLIYNIN